MNPEALDPRVAMLATVFRAVQKERMHDVPILNHALAVEAVGFCEWGGAPNGCAGDALVYKPYAAARRRR